MSVSANSISASVLRHEQTAIKNHVVFRSGFNFGFLTFAEQGGAYSDSGTDAQSGSAINQTTNNSASGNESGISLLRRLTFHFTFVVGTVAGGQRAIQ